METKRILLVLSSHDRFAGSEILAGFSLKQFATVYCALKKSGYDIHVASIFGGDPRPVVSEEETSDPSVQYFLQNEELQSLLQNTKALNECIGQKFAALCFIGGYGCMFDFPNNSFLDTIGRQTYESGGVIGCVGHGTIALASIRLSDGQLLLRGKTVTGFTNNEEMDNVVVHHLPDHFSNRKTLEDIVDAVGGSFSKGVPFALHTCRDGRIITCQNSASVGVFADQLVELIEKQSSV